MSDADCCVADDFERVYDHRLVRSSEVQGLSFVHGDSGELGDCLCRILLLGAGQPNRPRAVQCDATQDDSGGYYPRCVFNFLGRLSERSHEMELCGGIRAHRGGRLYHLQGMVVAA